MTPKYSLFFLFLSLLLSPIVKSQSDYVPGSGGVSAGGSVYVTFGQAACVYGTDAVGTYYNGQGVQQPYCTPRFDTIAGEVCQNHPFSIADFQLTADSTATAGLHHFSRHYLTPKGCDSTLTLALTIHAVSSETVTASACDNYEWHDRTFTTDTLFDYHATNIHGCDSTTTLSLTMRYSTRSDVAEQGAYQYSWHGHTYTESGDYADTMRSANAEGCDSIVSLRLSLLTDATVPTIYCFSRRLIMVDHYPWGDDSTRVNYRAYRWYHDGTLLPLATGDILFDCGEGGYRDLQGCYYMEVPADDGRNYWVRSNEICFPIDEAATTPVLSVYPNPAASGTPLIARIENAPQGSMLAVYDAYGRAVFSITDPAEQQQISKNLSSGQYTVTLQMPNGERLNQKIIVR